MLTMLTGYLRQRWERIGGIIEHWQQIDDIPPPNEEAPSIDVILTADSRYIGYVRREKGRLTPQDLPAGTLEVYTFQTIESAAVFCRIPIEQAKQEFHLAQQAAQVEGSLSPSLTRWPTD